MYAFPISTDENPDENGPIEDKTPADVRQVHTQSHISVPELSMFH